MTAKRELHEQARKVAELSTKLVKLAEALDDLETIVNEISAELNELGLADRLASELKLLVIPNFVAEVLQDELDQICGDLENEATGRGATAPVAPLGYGQPILFPGGPSREPMTVSERLMVRCADCGEHIACGIALSEPGFEKTTLDDRMYVCPSCGSTESYDTWDHFIE